MKNRNQYTYSARRGRRYAYPNEADPSYFAEKILDGFTALVTGMGAVTVLLFFVTM